MTIDMFFIGAQVVLLMLLVAVCNPVTKTMFFLRLVFIVLLVVNLVKLSNQF